MTCRHTQAEEARLGPRGIWASGKDGEAPSGGVSTDEEEEDEDVEALEFANRSRRKKRSWRGALCAFACTSGGVAHRTVCGARIGTRGRV